MAVPRQRMTVQDDPTTDDLGAPGPARPDGRGPTTAPDVRRPGAPPAPTGTIPTQRTRLPERVTHPGPRARVVLVAVAVAVAVAAAGTVTVQRQDRADQAAQRAVEAQARTAAAAGAVAVDQAGDRIADARTTQAVGAGARQQVVAVAQAAAAHAAGTLAATPNAGDGPRAQLQAAADAVGQAVAAPSVSLLTLRNVTASVATPEQAAVAAQAAWQAAEDARIAAEQAAAAEAARAAAARSTTARAPRTTTTTTRSTTPKSTSTQSSSEAAAPATSGVPSGGKVCTGAGGGAFESSVGDIGAQINAYRQNNGLPALSVSRSGTLVSHAISMAEAGGIWHSGSDNIVGCVSNGSASSLVSAWSGSGAHNAQMLRDDVSSMLVGGAGLGGWLYGAVAFR